MEHHKFSLIQLAYLTASVESPVVSKNISVIRLFLGLEVESLLLSGCCTSLYVSYWILQVFQRLSGVNGTELNARLPDVLLLLDIID